MWRNCIWTISAFECVEPDEREPYLIGEQQHPQTGYPGESIENAQTVNIEQITGKRTGEKHGKLSGMGERGFRKSKEKMVWVSEKNKDIIPYTTDANGNYDDRSSEEKEWNHDDGLNWWTNGFWGGIMWLLYQDTQEEKYAQIAGFRTEMEKCFESYFGLHHDVGFMFLPYGSCRLSLDRP
ncbi:MAG: hypothetical protein ACLR6I_04475 [Waltera sp.]